MAGKIGRDGIFLTEKLSSFGVDVSRVALWDGPTGSACIQVDDEGGNCIIVDAGGNGMITTGEMENAISSFSPGDILVLQNEINLAGEIMGAAKKRGMEVCLNPSPFDSRMEGLDLGEVTVLVVNEIEAALLLKAEPSDGPDGDERALCALAKAFPDTEVVMTCGGRGAWAALKGEVFHCPAAEVGVLDTTAAGDTFLGYYLASRSEGEEVEESLRRASLAAGAAVSRQGAMDSIPFRMEMDFRICCERFSTT